MVLYTLYTLNTLYTLYTEAARSLKIFDMAEMCYYYADWCRSQALYNEAAVYCEQATKELEDEIAKLNADGQRVGDHILNLYAKLLINQAELMKNCGQYFRATETVKKVQGVLRTAKQSGWDNFGIQGDFISCLIALFVIKGKV